MADRDRLAVLTDAQWAALSRSSRRAVPAARRRITTCVARSRRSSGGTRTGRSGAAFRLSLGRGGWQRKPSTLLFGSGVLASLSHQGCDEGAEEGFAAAPSVVHELEEAEIER